MKRALAAVLPLLLIVLTACATPAASVPASQELTLSFTRQMVPAVSGGWVEKEGWACTGEVPLAGIKALTWKLPGDEQLYSVAFFDKDHTFLQGVSTASSAECVYVTGGSEVPRGAVYARFLDFTGTNRDEAVTSVCAYGDLTAYEQKAPPVCQKEIVCLGDSLTEGDYGLTDPKVSSIHYENYPYYLEQLLHCRVVNQGQCGLDARQYLDFFDTERIDVSGADIVLVMLGTNRGLTLLGPENKDAYQALIRRLKEQMKSGSTLLLVTPPHATEDPEKVRCGYAPAVENARTEVLALAAVNGLAVIDAYAESPIQAAREDVYQPVDGLHMGREGYEAFAGYMAEKVQEMTAVS